MQSVKLFATIVLIWVSLATQTAAQTAEANEAVGSDRQTCVTLARLLKLDASACDDSVHKTIVEPMNVVQNDFQNVAPAVVVEPVLAVSLVNPLMPANTISRPADYDYRIHFPQGSDIIVEEFGQHLDMLAGILQYSSLSQTCLKLVGHSDTSGSAKANFNMGMLRAKAVKGYLTNRTAFASTRIEVTSEGEDAPLQGISTTDPKNRRVEIWARHCG
ncbi:OmpA family domain protein [Rhodobacterales bacterium HTCC2150]|nr:OmpA family domain protein [Rhodobacterales bacterium HTCC2150] [Rhodobacteraceae bacterium HTCC2150]